MSDLAPVTHIAGADITIGGRRLRQRCAWCGAILLDYDLTRIAVQVDPCDHCGGTGKVPKGTPRPESAPDCGACGGTGNEPPRGPATYPPGHLVRVEGSGGFRLSEVLDDTEDLPDDACASVHDEVTA